MKGLIGLNLGTSNVQGLQQGTPGFRALQPSTPTTGTSNVPISGYIPEYEAISDVGQATQAFVEQTVRPTTDDDNTQAVTGSYDPNTGLYQYGDGGPQDRIAAAQSLGYEIGQSTVPQMITGGLAVMGVPFMGAVSEGLTDPSDPTAVGQPGTIDPASGGVYASDGVAYDVITGQPVGYSSFGAAKENIFGGAFSSDDSYSPYRGATTAEGFSPASYAGIKTLAGEASIQNMLDAARAKEMAETADPYMDTAKYSFEPDYISPTGRVFDSSGISQGAPGAGTTFASGYLTTDDTGKVTGAAIPGTAEYVSRQQDDDNNTGPGVTWSDNTVSNYETYGSTYDEVGTGGDDSSSGGGGCFITTAIVERRGEEDDGETLTILRNFRDTYMGGKKSIDLIEYYDIAPKIIEAIPEDHSDWDWIDYQIQLAVEQIREDMLQDAYDTYSNMVILLKLKWMGE